MRLPLSGIIQPMCEADKERQGQSYMHSRPSPWSVARQRSDAQQQYTEAPSDKALISAPSTGTCSSPKLGGMTTRPIADQHLILRRVESTTAKEDWPPDGLLTARRAVSASDCISRDTAVGRGSPGQMRSRTGLPTDIGENCYRLSVVTPIVLCYTGFTCGEVH